MPSTVKISKENKTKEQTTSLQGEKMATEEKDDLYINDDNEFDFVISINTIHNLDRNMCKKAIKEMQRVSKGKEFIQVDSYKNEEQKKVFESWVLTARFYGYPSEWLKLFKECNYTGDWYWTIIN